MIPRSLGAFRHRNAGVAENASGGAFRAVRMADARVVK
jgi:hypothetical protein